MSSSLNSQNVLTPTMRNSNMIEISQVSRSTVTHANNLNKEQYEDFILYNLVKNNSPDEVSVNRRSIPSQLGINDTNLDIQINDPDNLKQHIIINNDDKYIQSEKFALNVEYNEKQTINTEVGSDLLVIGPNTKRFQADIKLQPDTTSFYDSNLKLEATLNNDKQYTQDSSWSAEFDRKYNHMNYFAAINSHLSTSNDANDTIKYPFRISGDAAVNVNSMGEDKVFFTQGSKVQHLQPARSVEFFSDTNGLLNNSLEVNKLQLVRNTDYINFDGTEFGSYKIEQTEDSSNVSLALKRTDTQVFSNIGTNYPVGTWTGADLSDALINLGDINKAVNKLDASNSLYIADGFTATLSVSNNSGGYNLYNPNSKFSLNDNELNRTGDVNNTDYFNNHKPRGRHFVDISTNGSVRVDSTNANASYVSLSTGSESLEYPYHTTPGAVYIDTKNVTQRTIDVTDPSAVQLFENNSIKVVYKSNETDATGLSQLQDNLRIAGDVEFDVKMLVEATANQSSVVYDINDKRNLCKNTLNTGSDVSNAVLVIANDNKPINFSLDSSFVLLETDLSKKIRNTDRINILNIKNNSKLVNDGLLHKALIADGQPNAGEISMNSVVPGVTCSVNMYDTNLTTMPYTDYRVKLTAKTAADISNNTKPTNGWTFDLTTLQNDLYKLTPDVSGSIIGDSNQQSEIINNVFAFLQGSTPINVEYKLVVDSTAESLANIRYKFNVTSNDPTSQATQYSFGYNDTLFENLLTDLSDTNLAAIPTSSVTGAGKEEYIFERWIRKKQYKALLNPSLPFYGNLVLKTDVTNEEDIYYRAWIKTPSGAKGFEASPLVLKTFTIGGVAMNIVNIRLVKSFGALKLDGTGTWSESIPVDSKKCNITLKPSECGILKANLQGKDLSNNVWKDLGYDFSNNEWIVPPADIEPYIKKIGYISNYDSSKLSPSFNCEIKVAFPLNQIVSEKNYYIDITTPLGDPVNTRLEAHLYSFSVSDIQNKPSLATDFSPYRNTFGSELADYKTSTIYNCDLSLNNGLYTLEISHLDATNTKKVDARIFYKKDYILNFNIIHSATNLLSIKKTVDSVVETTYNIATIEGNANAKALTVAPGVHATLKSNLVYGMRNTFKLKRDEVHVRFVDNDVFKYNHSYWADVSRNNLGQPVLNESNAQIKLYKPIVLTNGSLTIANEQTGLNKAKSIILNKTRGYTEPQININRTATTYTFTLDVSFENIIIDEKVNNQIVYIDISGDLSSNNVTVLNRNRRILFGDASYNTAVADTARTRYIISRIFDASSAYDKADQQKSSIDPSYNYTYERQTYTQTWNRGAGSFNIDTLLSNIIPGNAATWLGNTVSTDNSERRVKLNIGLKLNVNESVLADGDNTRTYEIGTSAAPYTFEFKNPNGSLTPIRNGTGSGDLFEGIIFKFFNFRTRSLKTPYPVEIKLSYTGSVLRVLKSSNYTGNPSTLGYVELATSPFYPDVTNGNQVFSLHPTLYNNANFPFKLRKLENKPGNFTSYLVCAPPSFAIEFNPLDSNIPTLPFPQTTGLTKKLYVDATTSSLQYNLFNEVDNTASLIGNDLIIKRETSINLHDMRTSSNSETKKFHIKGSNIKISLFEGVQKPQQYLITKYVDASSNLLSDTNDYSDALDKYEYQIFTDVSNNLTSVEYNGAVSDLISAPATKFRVGLNVAGKYDISYAQPIGGVTNNSVVNNTYNIHFTIDNAFIPQNTSYLPLAINKSSTVNFYDSRFQYQNGKYYMLLNKYYFENQAGNIGTDYNALLVPNSNVRQVSFKLNKKAQKAVELYALDNSSNRALVNAINLSDMSSVNLLLENLNVNDLSGAWTVTNITENADKQVGISLAGLDQAGMDGIRNLLKYEASARLYGKTLFIKRDDILKVLNAVGTPIFRITNTGNLVTPKVTTSVISLLQQSVTTASRPDSGNAVGLFSEGGLDFSGNWLNSRTYSA